MPPSAIRNAVFAGGEFQGYEPDRQKGHESPGNKLLGAASPRNSHIVAKGKGIAVPQLDEKLKRLIESSWKRAKPTEGARRGPIAAGQHRMPPGTHSMPPGPSNMPPLPPGPGNMPPLPSRPAGPGNMPPLPPVPNRPGSMPPLPPLPAGPGNMPPLPSIPPRSADTYHNVPALQWDQRIGKGVGGQYGLNVRKEDENKFRYLMSQFPTDWHVMRLIPLVSAFAFRGDTRDPQMIMRADGFQPSSTRTDSKYLRETVHRHFNEYMKAKLDMEISPDDFMRALGQTMTDPTDRMVFAYYQMWRGQVAAEAKHLGRMVAMEDMKDYISTTKSTLVAKGYAGRGGYVYAVLVRTGFLIPAKGAHKWTQAFDEEEIACPQPITWKDVVGYRQILPEGDTSHLPIHQLGCRFHGPVYMRPGMFSRYPEAAKRCFRALSGHDVY